MKIAALRVGYQLPWDLGGIAAEHQVLHLSLAPMYESGYNQLIFMIFLRCLHCNFPILQATSVISLYQDAN